ncbi:MAG: amino acid ABC transporter permease [Bacillota bacterium]|jgi:His/Glu/Gln/Arg/opine family amino acid ABC transporter permease subunit
MGILDVQFMIDCVPQIFIQGVPIALKIGLVSFFFGLLIGLMNALFRIYKIPVLNQLATLYISFFRGTPLMVQILIFYYGVPIILRAINAKYGTGIDVSGVPAITYMYIVYSLNVGSYLSESTRSAILSVPHGQVEAGYTLGMSTPKILRRVIIPQALTVALPNYGNTFIGLLKDTSLAFIASVPEIIGQAKIIAGRTSMFFESYIVAALIYWLLCIILEQVLRILEKRARKHERRA